MTKSEKLQQKTRYVQRVKNALKHLDGLDLDTPDLISALISIGGEVKDMREDAERMWREYLEERRLAGEDDLASDDGPEDEAAAE